jgi:hypothetical protein
MGIGKLVLQVFLQYEQLQVRILPLFPIRFCSGDLIVFFFLLKFQTVTGIELAETRYSVAFNALQKVAELEPKRFRLNKLSATRARLEQLAK